MGRSIDKSFDVDHEDALSFQSLDLEEAKAMLRDAPEQSAFLEPGKKQRMHTILYPCSIATNLIFFAFLLVVLGNPCYFSSRTCLYPKKEPDSGGLVLMGEEHGIVPKCTND
jgi:hypothetical protein